MPCQHSILPRSLSFSQLLGQGLDLNTDRAIETR